MNKLFKKKEIFKVKSKPVDPESIPNPSTADEYQRRGMAYYARKEFNSAESDLKKAVLLDPNHVDAYYSLGMVMKAVNRKEDAISAFNQVVNCITNNPELKNEKYEMLRKLALGHINEITQGDWNLEKEIWKHIE
jgi:tetratricopeptide (TPR) repeat protein